MSLPDRTVATRRSVVGLGVVAALTVGACATTGVPAEPLPPPLPGPATPAPAPPGPAPTPLAAPAEPWDSVARCETGGDWHADTGNGYQGGLQLSPGTWISYGGGQFAPQANEASREQQILVGDRIRAQEGWQAWSGCAGGISPG